MTMETYGGPTTLALPTSLLGFGARSLFVVLVDFILAFKFILGGGGRFDYGFLLALFLEEI
jgi:hypothetical protein